MSCLGGVFASFGSGNFSSLDWYFSQIPLPNMIYLHRILADYLLRLVNNVAIYIYTHDYIRMEITVL
jgi:hypothetical protein